MNIADYKIMQTLYHDQNYIVYRARHKETALSRILKVLKKKSAFHLKYLHGLQNEYELLCRITSDYVVKPIDFITTGDFSILVLEDIDGHTLKEEIQSAPLSLAGFQVISGQLMEAISAVHQQDIIHRDINPDNIIWNPVSAKINLIDFDIATKFNPKISYNGNPDSLEGTLSYISPEQTGRVNRRVDHRSDLYSLGITFYEMITGVPVFEYENPLEIVYAHLARAPLPPHELNTTLPDTLSCIILKLIEKNPRKRYQSVQGLQYDLFRAFENVEAAFTLGEKDYTGKLQVTETLYGRVDERSSLLAAYHRLGQKKREVVLVAGLPGTGKTSLVSELHKPITRDQGYFLSGKFDQLQRSVPYSALGLALGQFCDLLLSEPQDVLDQWKARILNAVNPLGKLLTDIVPNLVEIIGQQPDIPEIGGDQAMGRFNHVFSSFLKAVATEEKPVVLFIDDLQWADLESLSVLSLISEDIENSYLLVIGAYRDNEITTGHPFLPFIQRLAENDVQVTTIHVGNLTPADVKEWLAHTLRSDTDPAATEDLADLIFQKTGGNAFFFNQFLKNLHARGLLSFDFKYRRWSWDTAEIRALNITDNVVNLLVQKIELLSDEIQGILRLAACIGQAFELSTLSVISGRSTGALALLLEAALIQELIQAEGETRYKFIHDRVQQAVYTMIDLSTRQKLHLSIGRLLLNSMALPDRFHEIKEAGNVLFNVVNHLNMGMEWICDSDEKLILVRLNLSASKKAKRSAAFKISTDYIRTALALLPENHWQNHYDLTREIYDQAIQCDFLSRDTEQLEAHIDTVLSSAVSVSHRCVAHEYRIMNLIAQNQHLLAAEKILEIFTSLGVSIPTEPEPSHIGREIKGTQTLIERYGMDNIINLPPMDDPETRLILRLYYTGATAFMFSKYQNILPLLTSRMTALILGNGLCPETPYVLCLYGTVRIVAGDISGAYKIGNIARELIENRLCDDAMRVRSITPFYLYIAGNRQHYREVSQSLIDLHPFALNAGDYVYGGYIIAHYMAFLARSGTPLSVWHEKLIFIRPHLSLQKERIMLALFASDIHLNAELTGQVLPSEIIELDFEKISSGLPPDALRLCRMCEYLMRVKSAFIFERNDRLSSDVAIFEENWSRIRARLTYITSDYYLYFTLAYLHLYTVTEDEKEKASFLTKAAAGLKVMKNWAIIGSTNFSHKYHLLQAEMHRIQGDFCQAGEHYDRAIEKAIENAYINEAAIANELAARFYMHNGRDRIASLYFSEARACYQQWGAAAKVFHLDTNYPKYTGHSTYPGKTDMNFTTGNVAGTSAGHLDIATILKASQTLSREVQLPQLLDRMLRILMENAGARTVVLIRNQDGRLLIQGDGRLETGTQVLQALPVDDSRNIPLAVIHFVARTRETLVFENLSRSPGYGSDEYITRHQPKSAVCFPIIKQTELTGMVYLENNLIEGAFTPSRLEVLSMLSTQIAISMENAELYEDLEEKVRQRTHDLHRVHEELEESHRKLAKNHKKITDSVTQAVRIQDAALPDNGTIAKLLPNHFIFFRPCATVSGDFYWIRKIEDKIITAVADCTGHGVPGALVSMLGIAFLNDIVPRMAEQKRLFPDQILGELRTKVKTAFKQHGDPAEQQEGMDMGLCTIDLKARRIRFTGAHHPLLMIRDGKLFEFKGDRMPIAVHHREKPFTAHDISFEEGDMLYLFSDGFIDQIGEKSGKKFMKGHFKKLLLDISGTPLHQQKETLYTRFKEWKGNFPQVDDILILGFRL